ncbi:UNKNOWN [Stylonychia lemnae]|uniref:GT44 domain-containing protein n=1 Tax=Stylonychia lemnae TaxID=5949 RepID=A0A078ANC3_STYLE|nr:UNKNOWN [Stylonychia lemnae]|eukprot:CDW83401.1 UNKNOWN [Stylonychia lemnae]
MKKTQPEYYGKNLLGFSQILDTFVYKKNVTVRIPLITHRIWLTDILSPVEIDQILKIEVLQEMAQSYKLLTESAKQNGLNWTHYAWIQNMTLLPKTVKIFQDFGVEVKEIYDLEAMKNERKRRQFEYYVQDLRAISAGTDFLRAITVFEYGGIYFDNDYSFKYWDYNVNYYFDFFAIYVHYPWPFGVLETNFFAAKKGHIALQGYINLMVDGFKFNNESQERHFYQNDCSVKTQAVALFGTGPHAFGASVLYYLNQNGNQDIIVTQLINLDKYPIQIIDEKGQQGTLILQTKGRDRFMATWKNSMRDLQAFGWHDFTDF